MDVCSGVLQGSLLSPILFILYINDLPDSVSFSNIAMFADDTKCCHAIKNICDANQFQQDLDSLSVWDSDNELMFQPIICENIRTTRKRRSLQRSYTLNESTLKIVTSARDLGVQVSHNLTWANHIMFATLYPKPIECLVSYEDIAQRVSPVTYNKLFTSRW